MTRVEENRCVCEYETKLNGYSGRLIVAQVGVHAGRILIAQFGQRVLEDFAGLRWIVDEIVDGRMNQFLVIVAIVVVVVVMDTLVVRLQTTLVNGVDEGTTGRFVELELAQCLTSWNEGKTFVPIEIVCSLYPDAAADGDARLRF